MKLTRIAHAGIVIETRGGRCLMDPLFFNVFDSGASELFPQIRFDPKRFAKETLDCVVLSHEHCDHFSIPSLNLLDRRTPVVFPAGPGAIFGVLERMGFRELRPLRSWESLTFGDLTLMATPSRVAFPEMGVLFSSGKTTCWNLVDTRIDARIIAGVARRVGAVDALLATYQPLIETNLHEDALGGSFPAEFYTHLIEQVVKISPRLVIPSACGFRSRTDQWINDRQFPMTERKFLADVRKLLPRAKAACLQPGDTIDLHHPSRRWRASYVRPAGKGKDYQWQPFRGVPPLEDQGGSSLKREALHFLNRELPRLFSLSVNRDYLARLRKFEVVWSLRVVLPRGREVARVFDFRRDFRRRDLRAEASAFANIQTAVKASGLVAFSEGRISGSHFLFGGPLRTAYRLYATDKAMEKELSRVRREPLVELAKHWAHEKSLVFQLKELGF